jgi:glycosyltransferase involved in cell wall biosynthesis
MRLLFFTDTFLPEVNGVTTVLGTMRDGLRRRGHEVRLVAPGYGRPSEDETGIRRLPGIPCPGYTAVRLSWPWGRGLGAEADRFQPDLVHVVTEGPIGNYGRHHALRRGLPLITSFHTDFPRYAARYLGNWAAGPVWAYLRRFHQPAQPLKHPAR